jgi:hypothetical protein
LPLTAATRIERAGHSLGDCADAALAPPIRKSPRRTQALRLAGSLQVCLGMPFRSAPQVAATLLTLFTLAHATSALAQGDEDAGGRVASMDEKVVMKVLLGLGGDADVGPANADLDPSVGAAFHYEHPLHELLVLGGYAGLQSWTTSAGADVGVGRSTLFDLSALLKLRYPVNASVELYVAPILGVTLDSAADDAFGGETDLGLGWNFSALFGGQLAFTSWLGLMGEMGYGLHRFSHTVKPALGGAELDADVAMQQFNVTAGLYLDL